ncbi:DUF2911 domain-containing protein [Pedobacter montanisoli]|uniref:DUF2911 domain-containing protein n=1 Tax=Pedobacter montanisoli TaxID=2923277 RepID=A0ABS9ZU20_9SPHI|nr:DUF2911 domain-containing protein [Pedobacter montanisoli]MCJ0742085.1 DUF2911 domain-containing protein [Pedobacter montanisoli]
MKSSIKLVLVLFVLVILGENIKAQGIKMPQPSTSQTISQDFGLGKITVNYSRPNVKGRKIFGALELYDKVWRTGANSATVIKFTDAVKVEGKDLPAGEYALFTIPGKTEWTIIFNKGVKEWGAYTYSEANDVLRVKVKPTILKEKVETFTINFAHVYDTSAQMQLSWENTLVNVNLSTSIDERVMASIAEAMKGDKKPYFQSAIYYYSNGKDLKTALGWMNEAEKEMTDAPWVKLWKGRIQLKMGDKAGAAKSAKEGIEIATKIKNDEYIRLNTQLLDETKK